MLFSLFALLFIILVMLIKFYVAFHFIFINHFYDPLSHFITKFNLSLWPSRWICLNLKAKEDEVFRAENFISTPLLLLMSAHTLKYLVYFAPIFYRQLFFFLFCYISSFTVFPLSLLYISYIKILSELLKLFVITRT